MFIYFDLINQFILVEYLIYAVPKGTVQKRIG